MQVFKKQEIMDVRKSHLHFLKLTKSIENICLQENKQFGIEIMNILHILHCTNFYLTVLYKLKENICEINGTYMLKTAKVNKF